MHFAALALLLVCLCTSSCGDGSAPQPTQARARPALPSLRIVAMTDLDGYLEPCGCQSRPLGGLDRAAQRLRELGADGVPTLLLSAGNLFFAPNAGGHGGAAAETAGNGEAGANQEQWQAETLARALRALGWTAAVPGAADRRRPTLGALAATSGASLLCARDDEPAHAACQPSLLLERGGIQIGIFGLDASSDDPLAAAKRSSSELRARGAAIVIGVIDADARTARRLAGGAPGLDFLLHGGADSAEVPVPERVGSATLLRAGHQGQGLLVVDLFHAAGDGPYVDVSAWTRRAERSAQERRIAQLAERIADWRRDPHVDHGQLVEQEQRLQALQRQLQQEPDSRSSGKTFSARYIEIDDKIASDPELRALFSAHDRRVNEHNRVAFAQVKPKPVPAGSAGYIGSERCGACHEGAFAWWKQHPHGRAYATLERVDKQFSLSCVSCHVTGYGQPGGAMVVHNERLTNVGCESCHGPGSLHAADPDRDPKQNVRRAVAESVCRACHDSEHSDRFEYASYRQRLLVPGHGAPASAREAP